MSVCICQVSSLKQDLQVKEKQYEVRLQAVEDSHRHSTVELREMLTAQQQMSAKYVFRCSFLSAFYSLRVLCVVVFSYVCYCHPRPLTGALKGHFQLSSLSSSSIDCCFIGHFQLSSLTSTSIEWCFKSLLPVIVTFLVLFAVDTCNGA